MVTVKKWSKVALLVLALGLFGCNEEEVTTRPCISVVDVEKLMQNSVPAVKAKEHVKKVQEILQNSFEAVKKEWEKAPEDEKNKVLGETLTALNRHLEKEGSAAGQVVDKIMREEIVKWRNQNKGYTVINKQFFLDYDIALDVTDEILKRMNEVQPVFADLPKIEVLKRKAEDAKKDSEGKKENPSKEKKKSRNSGRD